MEPTQRTMSTKILIITDNLQNQVNGVVTTFRCMQEVARKDGYEFVYIDPSLFPHISAFRYPEVKLSFPIGIGKHIKQTNPDHIHIATEGPIGAASRIWLDKQKWKYNTSYHTRFPEFINHIYGIPEKWTYTYVRWFHKHSGKILTTTPGMAKELETKGFGNVIPWTRGVNRIKLSPTIQRQPRNKNKPIILSVGRISREKGLDDLIPLSDKYDIVIVGDGPYRAQLETKLPNAHFVGYQQGSALADYYHQADVFVFPSRTDTFGIVMIEAMSLGTPVAAYPVRGPIDIIEHGVTGVLDNSLDVAIKQALQLDRDLVQHNSLKWTWDECWNIFKANLIEI